MKRPTTLLTRILLNEGLQCSVAVQRDVQEIERRFEHEGESFLAIGLPSLCDALDQGLAQGFLTPSMFHGFKPCKRGGKLPAFMAGFFRNVFELDGALKDPPCIDSIRAIRQVTRLWKKVELPCSAARVKRAYERYVSNDASIDGNWPGDAVLLRSIAGYIWSDLEGLSGALYCAPGVFGGGATAERLAFNERQAVKQWPARGENLFPLSYHISHAEDDVDSFSGVEVLPREREQPVRVVQVPKTLKTPRTISVEPSYMMLRQQSIAKFLMAYLESDLFKHRSIRFTDQSVNREMARVGSIDGSLATIDLKDASDLVGLDLVKHIFSVSPTFLEYILESRSERAMLPDKTVIELRKFASMGSAMCFPIEAMVFFTIVMMSMVRQSGRRLSTKLLSELSAKVSVYGDDIIVPAETASGVMEDLESFGLKVNHDKSFTTGFFRESCGGDYYMGHDVTPAYQRQWDDSGKARDARVLSSYISLSNQLYLKGLWNASQFIRDHVESYHGPLPRTTEPCGVLTWTSVSFNTRLEWETGRCGWRVKGPAVRIRHREDRVRDIRAGMLLCFQSRYAEKYRRSSISGSSSFIREERDHRAQFGDSLSGSGNAERTHPGHGRPIVHERLWSNPMLFLHGDLREMDTDVLYRWGFSGRTLRERLDYLGGVNAIDFSSSAVPYATYTKRRWSPVHTG